jgi:hypothetical protein
MVLVTLADAFPACVAGLGAGVAVPIPPAR